SRLACGENTTSILHSGPSSQSMATMWMQLVSMTYKFTRFRTVILKPVNQIQCVQNLHMQIRRSFNTMPDITQQDQTTEFLLYTAPNGEVKVEVLLSNETIWLTQERMAELFGVQRPAITKHLKNIFESNELKESVVCSILEHTTTHGAMEGKTQTSRVKYYNLDAVISVGYRVNSAQATQFRIWATQLIKEYIIKGFSMDDERLKNGRFFSKDYFKELLERVRSIRASERRIYQQITDIFAECSIDYDPKSITTRNFYSHVQE
ncbi:virulence RhuM family protein, partial [Thiolapillus sp.]|uniref:virulence RhuM family protein n=9 Tax=Thiolapillus sp. TaxID=2017437 RepID=UPI00273999A1